MDTVHDAPVSPGAAVSEELVRIRGCRQAYHKDSNVDLVVLDNVDLTLHSGEIVGLLGGRAPANPPCCASSPAC